jgi:hypothetical protein
MTDDPEGDRISAEHRAAVSEMATVFVRRDPDALSYVSRTSRERGLSAVKLMVSSAWLVGDVLNTGVMTALGGRRPPRSAVIEAWQRFAAEARERMAAALNRVADEQIRAGRPAPEVRRQIAESAARTDAGLATALPLLTAFLTGDEAAFQRGLNAAAQKKQVTTAVLVTQLIIRDLFVTAVNTAVGGEATDEEILSEWETFMARRAASKRRV